MESIFFLRSGAMKFSKALILFLAVASLSAAGQDCAAERDSREMAIGSFGYVIDVPRDWSECAVDRSGSITLHLKVRPPERKGSGKSGAIGHFTVHVMERNGTSSDDWIDYHLSQNIPAAHGACRIDEVKKVTGGQLDATLICAYDMANHKGYGLLEGLLLDETHVLIVSYLHDPLLIREAHDQMIHALRTARLSPEAAARARLDYDKGLSLGFESFGLFVSLPRGWLPDRRSHPADRVFVALPHGSMALYLFRRTPKGLTGMLGTLRKKEPDLSSQVTDWTDRCKTRGPKMFRAQSEIGAAGPPALCVMGLHGKGGYALVLRSSDAAERALFEKTAAGIVLLTPDDAHRKVRDSIATLKKAIRERDREALSGVIPLLALCSENSSVARALAAGLNSKVEEIRAECAVAFGRIGSPRASKALEKTLKQPKSGQVTQLACIEALGTIGGSREQEILARFGRCLPKSCAPEVRCALDQSLVDLSR